MRMIDLIEKKKQGQALTKEEIEFLIRGYTKGDIPDYQMSAFLMAVVLKGMTDDEISQMTMEMAYSGDTVDLSQFGNLTADKHSTGGVGDKTSLIVAPIVSACGGVVAKMSGRGLGHTGGTVDKLESVKGYNTSLDQEAFFSQAQKVGLCLIGQTGNLTPADKKIYALRDVTATVDSIGLIVSSIMSKKISAGSKNIVLDVKVGSGAFMKDIESATALAEKMVAVGKSCNRNMAALITDMDTPLGNAVGNSLEVIEAIETLKGNGPKDLKEVSLSLASNMISLIFDIDLTLARQRAEECLNSGKALEKFKQWIICQGGDVSYIENTDNFEKAKYSIEVKSPKTGCIFATDTKRLGITACMLGAGREKKEDKIDFSAGFIMNKKRGDSVTEGEVIATLYSNSQDKIKSAEKMYLSALTFGTGSVEPAPVVIKTIKG